MTSRIASCLSLIFVVAVVGCGGPQNEVIVPAKLDPAAQQKIYDDYDKTSAAAPS